MYMANIMEEKVLNTFRGENATAPTSLYAGLLIKMPTGNDNATEISYTGYARQAIVLDEPVADDANYGVGGIGIKNTNKLVFPTTIADAGTAIGVGLYDALAGGNMHAYTSISQGLELNNDEEATLQAGGVKFWLEESATFTSYMKRLILNYLRGVSISGFTTYLGLGNGDPTTTGSELTGSTYSRIALTFGEPTQQSNESAQIVNTNTAEFNPPIDNWGLWNMNLYYDKATGGNLMSRSTPLDVDDKPKSATLSIGVFPKVSAGRIKISVN